jgi:hypothetical protein
LKPGTRNSNVTPGLFVDEVITTPGSYNFYLQSHAAIQGTARSAHYHVLNADVDWDDGSRKLTHALYCCFPRALKGVSYVAPAYIADRLRDRGRVYLKTWTPDRNYQLQPSDAGKNRTKELFTEWKKEKARDPQAWVPTTITVTTREGLFDSVHGIGI